MWATFWRKDIIRKLVGKIETIKIVWSKNWPFTEQENWPVYSVGPIIKVQCRYRSILRNQISNTGNIGQKWYNYNTTASNASMSFFATSLPPSLSFHSSRLKVQKNSHDWPSAIACKKIEPALFSWRQNKLVNQCTVECCCIVRASFILRLVVVYLLHHVGRLFGQSWPDKSPSIIPPRWFPPHNSAGQFSPDNFPKDNSYTHENYSPPPPLKTSARKFGIFLSGNCPEVIFRVGIARPGWESAGLGFVRVGS